MFKTVFVLSLALNIVLFSSATSWPKRDSKGNINIDDPQVGMYEGSADHDISGHGPDDEDDEDFAVIGNIPMQKPITAKPLPPSDDDEEIVASGDNGVPKKHCELKRDEASTPFVVGSYVPQCTDDGEYTPTQCHAGTGSCWCVDNGGMEVAGTRVLPSQPRPTCDFSHQVPGLEGVRGGATASVPATTTAASTSTKTACQQQKDEAIAKRLLGAFIPKCTADGKYESVQCHHDKGPCWCVDEVGQEVPGSRTQNGFQRPNCDEEVVEEVYKPEKVVPPEMSGPGDVDEPAPGEFEPENEDNGDDDEDYRNNINQMPVDHEERDQKKTEENAAWDPESNNVPEGSMYMQGDHPIAYDRSYLFDHPGLLAAIIGSAVFGLLCAVLLVMFIVYRMRKKDEGSYPLDERKRPPVGYTRAYQREMYA